MADGAREQTTVVNRLITAAEAPGGDPGWSLKVQPTGIQITYTWLAENNNNYTVESLVPWKAIAHSNTNPLLSAMADLIAQAENVKI